MGIISRGGEIEPARVGGPVRGNSAGTTDSRIIQSWATAVCDLHRAPSRMAPNASGYLAIFAGYPLPSGWGRDISRHGCKQCFRVIFAYEHVSVYVLQETLLQNRIEKGAEALIETFNIEKCARFDVVSELRPGPDLKGLFQCPNSTWQRNESIRKISHEGFSFVHGRCDTRSCNPLCATSLSTSD